MDAGDHGRIHIAAICRNHKTCEGYQRVSFDDVTETWGSMLVFLRANGWNIMTGHPQSANVLDATCPKCSS